MLYFSGSLVFIVALVHICACVCVLVVQSQRPLWIWLVSFKHKASWSVLPFIVTLVNLVLFFSLSVLLVLFDYLFLDSQSTVE